MNVLVESLESRTLLSALPSRATGLATDQAALNAMLRADKAGLANCAKAAIADVRTLTSDLRKTRNSQTLALGNMVRRDTVNGFGLLTVGLKKLASTESAAGQRLVADAQQFFKNPLNATLIACLGADATAIFNLNVNSVFGNDVTSMENVISADLNQISAANSSDAKLQADTASEQAAVQRCAMMAQSDGNALTNSLGTLFNDIRSLVPLGLF